MTELEVLQEISSKLSEQSDFISQIHNDIGYLVYGLGIIVGLILITLFAAAWGRNT